MARSAMCRCAPAPAALRAPWLLDADECASPPRVGAPPPPPLRVCRSACLATSALARARATSSATRHAVACVLRNAGALRKRVMRCGGGCVVARYRRGGACASCLSRCRSGCCPRRFRTPRISRGLVGAPVLACPRGRVLCIILTLTISGSAVVELSDEFVAVLTSFRSEMSQQASRVVVCAVFPILLPASVLLVYIHSR